MNYWPSTVAVRIKEPDRIPPIAHHEFPNATFCCIYVDLGMSNNSMIVPDYFFLCRNNVLCIRTISSDYLRENFKY